jgi:hypothetical protein
MKGHAAVLDWHSGGVVRGGMRGIVRAAAIGAVLRGAVTVGP